MSRSRDDEPGPDPPGAGRGAGPEEAEPRAAGDPLFGHADRRQPPGPLEGVFQEVVRRTAALGFSSFFLTEEALRRAFSDAVPQDWVEYLNRQGDDVRREVIDRLVAEFAAWLRTLDVSELLGRLFEEYSAQVEISVKPRSSEQGPALQVVTRRR